MNEFPEYPIEGMKVIPYGWPFMSDAWAGLLSWAIQEESILNRFETETGMSLESLVNRTAMEALIDKCSGREREMMVAFADWVTVNLWGVEE